ncbi:MAG: kelch repeat-containing protein [Deltaproteobacteria bacterium]
MLPLRAAWLGALVGFCACSSDEAGAPRAAERELARLLGPSQGRQVGARVFGSSGVSLPASGAPERASARLELSLPERADEPFALRDARSELAIHVHSSGARAVAAQSVGALSVYAEAHGSGTALLLQPNEHGLEDYVSFSAPPAEPRVEYRVALGPEVRGLRLVARTLEFLDAGGAPRLRVEPPVVIGADGVRTPAALELSDCDVDLNPAAPWGRPSRDPGASSCALRVTCDPERVLYPALVDPVWSGTGSMSQGRESFASLLLPNGRVLAAGGLSGVAGEPSASAELYDPVSGTWSVAVSLSAARSAFTLIERDSETGAGALAVGGEAQGVALSSSELYDLASGRWSAGPELSEPHAGHGALRFDSGDILVAGGASLRASLLARDARSWSDVGELLAAEPGSSLTLLENQDVLLVGPNAPSAQRYERDLQRWRASAEPELARSEHTATRLLDGQVLLVGGSGSRSAELYDPASESFHFVGALNEARARHTATLLGDGRVVVVGGSGVPGALATETYNPIWGTWTPGPGAAQARAAHSAVLLADGRLLAIGGRALDGPILASADRLDPSPLPTTISEYKLPARLDPEVTASTVTELWAAVARPATLVEGRRYPLLLFLHGNHGTCGSGENPRSDFDCTYTESGVCPDGFVVVPSHRGYDYMAQELAARGFVVVSVNANRGITCGGGESGDGGFNLARGRLLLQHLRQLSAWNRGTALTPESVGVSLEGKLDFNEVGMMGHSRGGEGVRAAYEQYRDAGSPWPQRIVEAVTFRALFEIGPVDGQTSRVLNADGVAWNVLLPMCDGDVSDLEGVKPFDRMLGLTSELRETPKSTYVAWGTNHNFFNSEWQESDSSGCQDHRALFEEGPGITGSAEQRQIGLRSMLSFFLANVGRDKNPALSELFDPTSPVELNTRVDRGYTSSLRLNRGITLEDFSGPNAESAHGLASIEKNVTVVHGSVPEHDPQLRAARVSSCFRWATCARTSPGTRRAHSRALSSRSTKPASPVRATAFACRLATPRTRRGSGILGP